MKASEINTIRQQYVDERAERCIKELRRLLRTQIISIPEACNTFTINDSVYHYLWARTSILTKVVQAFEEDGWIVDITYRPKQIVSSGEVEHSINVTFKVPTTTPYR